MTGPRRSTPRLLPLLAATAALWLLAVATTAALAQDASTPTTTDVATVPSPVSTDDGTGATDPLSGLFADAVQGTLSDAVKQMVSSLVQLAAQGQNYIITLDPSVPVDQILEHVAWIEDKLNVGPAMGHIVHKYHVQGESADTSYYGYAATLHPALLDAIKSVPLVHSVSKDDIASISQQVYVQAKAPWGLSRICRTSPPNYSQVSSYFYNSQRGIGVDAYVLDTGVYTQHKDFGGRATAIYIPGVTTSMGDPNGHGTHVAGIIGSNTYGVAKGVNIKAIQVLGASGTGPWSNMIKGLEYVVQQKQQNRRPTVVNISVVGTPNQALNQALLTAVNSGVVVVVAAGNSAIDTCTTSPGAMGGSNSALIAVGSIGQQDVQSFFSNYGACNDISAPGEFIDSLGTANPTAVKNMSGTSMASPHVAGSAALVLSMAPTWSPAQVKWFLKGVAPGTVTQTNGGTNKSLYLPTRLH